jgi:acyl phosphate:glycerol-3-phosphate acyltransferase
LPHDAGLKASTTRTLTFITATVAITSFLLGSIPFGYLLVRIFRGQDVRKTGSGNIGATNVARTGSKGLAIATLLLDALKGYAAVAFATWIPDHIAIPISSSTHASLAVVDPGLSYFLAALAALCVILGHMFTPWLGFKGGKGVAAAVGAFAAIAPRAILISLAVFVVIVAITRYVSLGSILGAAVFPMAAYWLNPAIRSANVIGPIALSSLLIIIRHHANIRRLLAGNENRLW